MKNEPIYHKWKQDERLQHLDPKQLELLSQLAEELSNAPMNEKAMVFFSIMQKTKKQNISFSPPEQELLFSILTEHMSPEEKKKARMIRNLSSQFTKQQTPK